MLRYLFVCAFHERFRCLRRPLFGFVRWQASRCDDMRGPFSNAPNRAALALIARVLVASGRPLPVQPFHLLGKLQPAACHFFECAFYGHTFCLRGTIFGLGHSMSVLIRP
jgi:hypothetical protein